jgi:hypothetical protein
MTSLGYCVRFREPALRSLNCLPQGDSGTGGNPEPSAHFFPKRLPSCTQRIPSSQSFSPRPYTHIGANRTMTVAARTLTEPKNFVESPNASETSRLSDFRHWQSRVLDQLLG